MTKTELTEISNKYKHEYNNSKQQASIFNHTISTFNHLKQYFESSLSKIHKRKAISILGLFACVPISIACIVLRLPFSIISTGFSFLLLERLVFFNNTIKKFEHCQTYLNKSIRILTDKQLSYEKKCENALSEIIKLENIIPDEIKHTNSSLQKSKTISDNKKDDLSFST